MCADWGDDEFWREQQASNRKISSFRGECNDNPTFSPWNLKSNVSILFKQKKAYAQNYNPHPPRVKKIEVNLIQPASWSNH